MKKIPEAEGDKTLVLFLVGILTLLNLSNQMTQRKGKTKDHLERNKTISSLALDLSLIIINTNIFIFKFVFNFGYQGQF